MKECPVRPASAAEIVGPDWVQGSLVSAQQAGQGQAEGAFASVCDV